MIELKKNPTIGNMIDIIKLKNETIADRILESRESSVKIVYSDDNFTVEGHGSQPNFSVVVATVKWLHTNWSYDTISGRAMRHFACTVIQVTSETKSGDKVWSSCSQYLIEGEMSDYEARMCAGLIATGRIPLIIASKL